MFDSSMYGVERTPEQGKIALCRRVLWRTENELQSNIAASMQPAGKERVNQTPENSAHMTQNQSRQIQRIIPIGRLLGEVSQHHFTLDSYGSYKSQRIVQAVHNGQDASTRERFLFFADLEAKEDLTFAASASARARALVCCVLWVVVLLEDEMTTHLKILDGGAEVLGQNLQDNVPWHSAKVIQEWFEDEHDKVFKVSTSSGLLFNLIKPSPELLIEYCRKVDFLKGLLEAEKLSSPTEKALANQFLAPGRTPTISKERTPVTKTVHLQTQARYTGEMRNELLEKETNNKMVVFRMIPRRSPSNQGQDSCCLLTEIN
ncbi:unnamed protein product [Ranitomeya imitator]|uniref:Vesicle transport protein USE1 n=1 Tax=Ranitomeya imitator TaxID=111125 RepID=A0ABN9LIM0_9NEOB|nr:unnamed protein product [Ranitomeya imitator]